MGSSSGDGGGSCATSHGGLAQRWLAPLIPGASHAVTTVAVGFPFDTVKTRLQVGMHTSTLLCVRQTVAQEGLLALYRGALMPLAALMCKRPLEFAVFEWCSARYGAKAQGPLVGGFAAGIISGVLGCPFSVLKVQMQASRKDAYRNTFEVALDVWRSRGIPGFFRGIGASLIMSVPSTTFYLGVYGYLREALPATRWSTACAGVVASLSMWTCLLPLDNVRTVIQATSFKDGAGVGAADVRNASWLTHLGHIVRARGILGLWAGWTAVVARAPIVSAASMLAYEHARSVAG